MQPAPSPVFYEPPLAAKPQLREKPHQGLPSKNPAWNQGPNVCNFTVTLGLRATVVENGVGETYSARYYNPNTGRFLSRDPEDGRFWDPKTLHKYLFAAGDPVNISDPTGRDLFEYLFARRTGILNTNAYVRLGLGWNNVIKCVVFRLAILSAGAAFHWHFDFWDYCP